MTGRVFYCPLCLLVIRFAEAAKADRSKLKYYVLLILTDGAITDEPETIDCIIKVLLSFDVAYGGHMLHSGLDAAHVHHHHRSGAARLQRLA